MRLEITRRAGLAVRAVTALHPPGSRHKAADVAASLGATPGFTTQVLNPLVKAGWVASVPGPTGGYALTPAADGLSALDVIEAVDGPTATGDCVVEARPCRSSDSCALHEAWVSARAVLTRTLAQTPVAGRPPSGQPAGLTAASSRTTAPTPVSGDHP